MLPTTEFAYQFAFNQVCTLCVSHTLHSTLESRHDGRIMRIYFSVACDRVNHLGILYKLCSVGIGGSVLSNWHSLYQTYSLQSTVANLVSRRTDRGISKRSCVCSSSHQHERQLTMKRETPNNHEERFGPPFLSQRDVRETPSKSATVSRR